jgi:SAM-dependent methyltransferase
LADAQADLAVYNASFHYAADAVDTLREALRVLQPAGRVVILDTAIYHRDESGRQMVEEKHAGFAAKYGTRSDHLPCVEYLTWDGLHQLGQQLGLRFTWTIPWYGWRWATRPWVAKLKKKREPSRFAVVVGSRT